ncbi:zinc finger BED domain-containing protein RICESLEEPER 3 isoform X1 [Rhododendron vialii]|uniref:zinc finger BED domain-containing protein RICESLEEPER 3 isoform X1 n=2 Tax=Rhododendron vialii TaxID=182163 RepID=UPI00265EF810|nr:zinc finger BED domain-containing protein RICESLEEPER 3 isoform X1 [Rhododendron vialii]XP_058227213.1 zinc finger BED domain-containing protein RICESLEEPER 3 isoform X1 [Rhododendron vialii]
MMNFGTGTVSGKGGNLMEWSVNNTFKSLKDMEPKSVMDMSIIPSIDPIDIGLGSSEKGSVVPTPKPRKKTMTSVYLKFFETAPDGKSRRCKFCGQSYSIATATGNLGRHLSNRHAGYDKTGDGVTNPTPQPITVVVKKPQSQAKPPQVDLDHLNWLLIKWLILAAFPPSSLEEKWLANSFKFLNPSVQVWPGDKFHAVLREVFRSMREDVRAILEQVSSKLSITLDFWSSYEQIFYMSVTCQWIDENWSFQKVLLDICHIPSPCGGSEIYQTLVKVLKLYDIDNRVLSCTHDNSPDSVHACHTLKGDIDSQKVGPFCYVPCAARTLNSIINDGLRTTKPVISKIREVVLEMNASAQMSDEFMEFATAFQEGSWKFPLDASARWSGSYQMLDIVRKAGKSLETVTRKYEETLGSRMLLNPAEKNAVNITHTFLEPFYKTTNNICTNKVPTIGLVVFFMDHISETIAACRDSRHSPDWLKAVAEEMATKARKYNDQVCNIFTYMTAILDPRIKVELIPESLNSENHLEEARSHFIRNYSVNHFPSITTGFGPPDLEDGGTVSFAEEIARKKRRVSMSSSATDELTQYLSEPPAPIPTDVLEWWKVNSTRYPRLSVMARDFLAVQATSVAPEELFCSKGDEVYKQRFAVPHNSAQALLCIKSWTQGGVKLKYKSTEIDYERLMELAASAAADNNNAVGFEKKLK